MKLIRNCTLILRHCQCEEKARWPPSLACGYPIVRCDSVGLRARALRPLEFVTVMPGGATDKAKLTTVTNKIKEKLSEQESVDTQRAFPHISFRTPAPQNKLPRAMSTRFRRAQQLTVRAKKRRILRMKRCHVMKEKY